MRSRLRILAGFLAILPGAALAADAVVDRTQGVLHVDAWVHADAPAAACYEVLTDFERLPDFVPGIRACRVGCLPGEMRRVEQVGVTGPVLFALTVRTTLGLSLAPPGPGREGRIDFSSLGGNLRQMSGAWRVRDDKTGCRIDYQAAIEPDFPVPPLIGPWVVRAQIEGQLDAIAREIARRQVRGGGAPAESQAIPLY